LALDIFITLLVVSSVQSIFGTGVLLFGTPVLLLLGYSFQFALILLLPISVSINSLQIKDNYKDIDFTFFYQLILYCLPFVALTLYFIDVFPNNLNLCIGIFLILLSLKNKITLIENLLSFFLKKEPIYLILMGILHGLTNLGGSLLSGVIFNRSITKDIKRVTIAVCYFSMGLIQIITLLVKLNPKEFLANFNFIYWVFSIVVYFFVRQLIFDKINNVQYTMLSQLFLFVIGFALIVKTYI
tara:strand:+ start:712 stop:1437 length:726 start_codon:yes stop_codon:yes gene_type:complete